MWLLNNDNRCRGHVLIEFPTPSTVYRSSGMLPLNTPKRFLLDQSKRKESLSQTALCLPVDRSQVGNWFIFPVLGSKCPFSVHKAKLLYSQCGKCVYTCGLFGTRWRKTLRYGSGV